MVSSRKIGTIIGDFADPMLLYNRYYRYGYEGVSILDPAQNKLDAYKERLKKHSIHMKEVEKGKYETAITRDGERIEVFANVGNVKEARSCMEEGAEGIGLLRTEFLFLNRSDPPGKEEIASVLKDIGLIMKGKPVIVRTLDLGGDKLPSYMELPKESNPFLGVRGIRLCLKSAMELFKDQLRAILMVRNYCKIRIMFPMISTAEEAEEAKRILLEVAEEMDIPDEEMEKIKVGVMIETPSSALISDSLADVVDFFSIGTNDLTQYTLAADRTNENLSQLYDYLHPSVIKLIEMSIRSAHDKGKVVGVCGEMAGDPDAIPLLIGLGVDELSVAPPMVPEVKHIIRKFSTMDSKRIVQLAKRSKTAAEVRLKLR